MDVELLTMSRTLRVLLVVLSLVSAALPAGALPAPVAGPVADVAGAAGLDATLVGQLGPCQPIGPCLATDALLDNGPWEQLVTELMDEVIASGCALGHDLSPGLGKHQRNRTRVMKAYLSSTLIDFKRGLPLELDALFRLPLGRAQASGVETPRLVALCDLLTELDNRRKNSGSDAA